MAKSGAKFFQRESLFRPKHVDHKVGEHELRFYPVSLNMLWKLKTAFSPIVDALRTLSAGKNDVEQIVDRGKDEEGNERIITQIGAVKPELARLRAERSDAAWSKALEVLFGDESRKLVGELIADSLRDDFTREQASDPDVGNQVISAMDLGAMVEMVNGLIKANASLFGPFAEKVRKVVSQRVDEALGGSDESEDRTSTDAALAEDGEHADSENESSSPRIVS